MSTPHHDYTAESCFSCRIKKRKCDRLMPACSRCKKSSQQCLYGGNGVYGSIVPIRHEKPLHAVPAAVFHSSQVPAEVFLFRGRKSCRRCRLHKKSCDKTHPSCGRCKRLDACCDYDDLVRIQRLNPPHLSSSASMVRDLDLQPSYPIEPKPYIPGFIRSFQEQMGLAALQVEVNSIAYHLRSSWIRHALTDPCLFHATLYTASAEMDAMRGMQGTTTNYATLYHQTNTIRLLNRRLAHGGPMDDATIASVLLLVISGSIEKDPDATEAHRQGLLRMVALRGGLKQLGFDGILAEMIEMNMVLPMVVFGQTDSALPAPVTPAEALPDSLPSLALARLRRGGSRINPPLQSQLLRVLEHIQDLFHALVQPSESSNLWTLLDNAPPTVELTTTGESAWSSSETSFLRTCQLSMTLLRTLADPSLPWHPDTIAVLLRDLNTSITQTDPATRLRYAPEASLWATALGMAVSPDVHGRLTFLINERCVVLAVSNSRTTALHELFLDCYCRLRALVELRQPPTLSPLPSTPPSIPFPLE